MSPIAITRLLLLTFFLSLELASHAYGGDPPPAERDTPQGEKHFAVARVIQDYKNPYSFAQLEPAPFTIPKGYVATAFNYRWVDPKTDRKNEKLTATTIYSVTEQRYLTEVKNNPDFILKAGEYKAVCGGMAGATGVLGYTLILEDLVKKTDDVVKTTPPKTPSSTPQPPSDTTKTEVKEGKRKVHVIYSDWTLTNSRGVTQWSGDVSATLTVSGGAIRLDFDTNPGETPKETDRWEGTLTRQGQVLTVKGSTLTYYPPVFAGAMSSTWRGTFDGHLEGTVLKGTMAAHNGDVHADMKAEWSIKDFAK